MSSRIVGRSLGALVVAGCAAAISAFAHAQPDPPLSPRADTLFDQGKALLDSDHVDEACVALADSYALHPTLGALGMLAWCHEKQGRLASAWREYSQAAEMADRQREQERASVARQRASELQPRLATLRIDVAAPADGLVVTRGGDLIDELAWGKPVPVDPGDTLLIASAPGFLPWMKFVVLQGDGVNLVVEIPPLVRAEPLRPAAPLAVPNQPPPRALAQPYPEREWKLPLVAAGIATASLAAGTWFGIRAWSKNEQSTQHCDASQACDATGGKLRDEARTSGLAANVAFGTAAVAAAGGALLWLRAPSRSQEAPVRVQPDLGLRSAGLRIEGLF